MNKLIETTLFATMILRMYSADVSATARKTFIRIAEM